MPWAGAAVGEVLFPQTGGARLEDLGVRGRCQRAASEWKPQKFPW